MSKSIQDRVDETDRGENPTLVCRMKSGHLVLADVQTPRGWTILVRVPVVHDLQDLAEEDRAQFLTDMAAAGEALARATGAYRMNYSILGNTDPALHAHLHPRMRDEPDELRRQPLWAIWRHLDRRPFDRRPRGPADGGRPRTPAGRRAGHRHARVSVGGPACVNTRRAMRGGRCAAGDARRAMRVG